MTAADLGAVLKGIAPVVREFIADSVASLVKRLETLEARPVLQAKDGVGVASLTINADGRLLVHLTDGRQLDAGPMPVKDGAQGPAGLSADPARLLGLESETASIRAELKTKQADIDELRALLLQEPKGLTHDAVMAMLDAERQKWMAEFQQPKDGTPGPPGPRGDIGEPGIKGIDGIHGKDGRDGIDGKDGAQGPQGERGEIGPAGEKGVDGQAGARGLNGQPGPVGERGEQGSAGAPGETGPMGPAGEAGPAGERGASGAPGSVGPTGEKGMDGVRGPEGQQGLAGRDGLPGVQGPGGEKGLDGRHGIDGIHGKDGLGFDDLSVLHDGERGFTFQFSRGDQVKSFPFTIPCVIYRDLWTEGKAYEKGDAVTFGGCMWVAKDATTTKPDFTPAATKFWRLAIKEGRKGKDADPAAIEAAVNKAVAKLPKPKAQEPPKW